VHLTTFFSGTNIAEYLAKASLATLLMQHQGNQIEYIYPTRRRLVEPHQPGSQFCFIKLLLLMPAALLLAADYISLAASSIMPLLIMRMRRVAYA